MDQKHECRQLHVRSSQHVGVARLMYPNARRALLSIPSRKTIESTPGDLQHCGPESKSHERLACPHGCTEGFYYSICNRTLTGPEEDGEAEGEGKEQETAIPSINHHHLRYSTFNRVTAGGQGKWPKRRRPFPPSTAGRALSRLFVLSLFEDSKTNQARLQSLCF